MSGCPTRSPPQISRRQPGGCRAGSEIGTPKAASGLGRLSLSPVIVEAQMRPRNLVLVVVLALAVTACSHGDGGAQPESATTEAAAAEPTGPLHCADPITIGVVTDLTGGLSIYGTELERGSCGRYGLRFPGTCRVGRNSQLPDRRLPDPGGVRGRPVEPPGCRDRRPPPDRGRGSERADRLRWCRVCRCAARGRCGE